MAILVDELGMGASATITATDISRRSLAVARAGVYTPWSVRGSNLARATRRLRHEAGTIVVDESIRSRVDFRRFNLASAVRSNLIQGLSGFDAILCRNVLIYFDRPTIERVAHLLYDALAAGGWLVLASSDPPLGELAPFTKVATERGIFYRRPFAAASCSKIPVSAPREKAIAVDRPAISPPAPSATRRKRPPASAVAAIEAPPSPVVSTAETALARVRSLGAAGDTPEAERHAREAVVRFPLDPALAFVHALLLHDAKRDLEAATSLRRAIYLDPTFIMAHLTLAVVLVRLGDVGAARRAFRTVIRLCAGTSPETMVPLSEGASAAHIASVARFQDASLAGRGAAGA